MVQRAAEQVQRSLDFATSTAFGAAAVRLEPGAVNAVPIATMTADRVRGAAARLREMHIEPAEWQRYAGDADLAFAARGTMASPASIQSGDFVGEFFAHGAGAGFVMEATEAFTLGGTISGCGNQLANNVLVYTTPLEDMRRAVAARSAAVQRGEALLKAWLTDEQSDSYERRGSFEVRGGSTGRRYRIRVASPFNVELLDNRSGEVLEKLCFVPEGELVNGDILLAQKLALETNETAALNVANVQTSHRVYGGLRNIFDWPLGT